MYGPDNTDFLPHPETSTGVMQRISAERLIARELQALCDSTPGCKINPEAWQDPETFMFRLSTDMPSLLADGLAQHSNWTLAEDIYELPDPVDDDALWHVPWVLFNNGVALGTADRHEWRQERWPTCKKAVLHAVESDPTATFVRPIQFCDVTGPLQDLCTRLRNARGLIETANCVASNGDCEVLASYYTPAQWSATNKAFVRETVRDFYRYQAPDACTGENDRVKAAEQENLLVQPQCDAAAMQIVKEGLELARLGVRMLLAVFMSLNAIIGDIVLAVFYVLQQQNTAPLIADILYQIQNIVALVIEGIHLAFNTLVYVFAEISGIGKLLSGIFRIICQAFEFLMNVIVQSLTCIVVREGMPLIVGFIDDIVSAIDSIFAGVHTKPWEDFKVMSAKFADTLECLTPAEAVEKSKPENSKCISTSFGANATDQFRQAFLPTRCWTNPFPGDSLTENGNALACSGTDTCIVDSAVSSNYAVCESCPDVDVNHFQRFGCDMALRRCKCTVPIVSRTACSRNSDCWQTTPCALVASLGAQAMGTVDCQQSCTQTALCYVEESQSASAGGMGLGQCVCPLSPPLVRPCENTAALMALPVDHGTCFLARDYSLASSLDAYSQVTIEIAALAVTPCALLRRSNVDAKYLCMDIRARTGTVTRTVVGTELLVLGAQTSFRRLLLWENTTVDPSLAWHPLVPYLIDSADWSQTYGPCAPIVHAYRSDQPLTVSERFALQQCAKWRAIANVTATIFNLTAVQDNALLSVSDAAAAALEHFAAVGISRFVVDPFLYFDVATYLCMQAENVGTATIMLLHRTRVRALHTWNWIAARLHSTTRASHSSLFAPLRSPSENETTWHNITAVTTRCAPRTPPPPRLGPPRNAKSVHKEAPPSPTAGDVVQAVIATFGLRRLLTHQTASDDDDNRQGWPLNWADFVRSHEPELLTCELYDISSHSTKIAYDAMQKYHKDGYTPRNQTSPVLQDNFMRGVPHDDAYEKQRQSLFANLTSSENSRAFGLFAIDSLVDAIIAMAGASRAQILDFFDPPPNISLRQQINDDMFTLPRLFHDLSHCDVRRVMLCDNQPKNLMGVLLICTASMFILAWLLRPIDYVICTVFRFLKFVVPVGLPTIVSLLPSTATSTFVLVPWFVMWYAYGYSPACFPMVPTCFGSDVVALVNATFPAQAKWPALLIHQDICALDGLPYNTTLQGINCFKSCASDEFRFREWQDALAWILCDMDTHTCQRLGKYLADKTSLGRAFHDSTLYFAEILAYSNQHLTSAHRFCGFVTGFYIVPVLLLVVWLLVMAVAIANALLVLLANSFLFLLQSLANPDIDPLDDTDDANEEPDNDTDTTQPKQ